LNVPAGPVQKGDVDAELDPKYPPERQEGAAVPLALFLVCVAAPRVGAAPILTNGDFTAGFTGWTVLNQPGSFAGSNWCIQTGTVSPISGFPAPPPPGPPNAAMTDQGGPGSHVLYQDFTVPFGVTGASLTFDRFIGNRDGGFFTPDTLDFSVSPNQQARVDLI